MSSWKPYVVVCLVCWLAIFPGRCLGAPHIQIVGAQLTADGRWFVCLEVPAGPGADGVVTKLVLRDVSGSSRRQYALGRIGSEVGEPVVSDSGRWVAVFSASLDSAGKKDVSLVDVRSGKRRDFASEDSFRFIHSGEREWLVLETRGEQAADPIALTLFQLESGKTASLEVAVDRVFDASGTRLAWSDAKGLHAYDLLKESSKMMGDSVGRYESLTWSQSGNALAALRIQDSRISLVVASQMDGERPRIAIFSPQNLSGMPADYEISTDGFRYPNTIDFRGPITWRNDERGLFIGIRPVSRPQSGPVESVTGNLAIWHWRDGEPPGVKEQSADIRRLFSYLTYVSLTDGRFVRLADESLPNVNPHAVGVHLLGFDDRGYEPALSRTIVGDCYLVNLLTGQRTLLVKGLRSLLSHRNPALSPDGDFVLYQEQGDYISYDVLQNKRHHLTRDLPTRFYLEENNKNMLFARHADAWVDVPVQQGWSVDGARVLLSDYRDVWALSLSGERAINLTMNGRRDDIIYGITHFPWNPLAHRLMQHLDRVDLNAPLYFTLREPGTGRTGLAVRTPGAKKVETLNIENAALEYYKATRAEKYLVSRRTAQEPPVISVVGSNWKPGRALARETNDEAASPGHYLTYTTSRGDRRNAVLYAPKNAVPSRAYPTIVSIYEEMLMYPHRSWNEDSRSGNPLTSFWKQGYALLFPSIAPRTNEAGFAALESVTAAVEAAVGTGIVDRNRVGLIGHSMGGYETLFIATQTDMFRAVVPMGALANLWSLWGSVSPIKENRFNWVGVENAQPYLAGPWWDHWEAYLKNSPVYHVRSMNTPMLIVHGDQDDQTPFSNIMEFFAGAHRLRDKPVVLLEYKGLDHGADLKNPEIRARVTQFLDHFLKDAPAPDWWANGVSVPAGKVPALAPISSQ